MGKLLQSSNNDQSSRVFCTVASDDVYKISIVEQCQFLEEEFGTSFTERFLNGPNNADDILKEAKHTLVEKDWSRVLEMANSHCSLKHVSDPTHGVKCGTLLSTMASMVLSQCKHSLDLCADRFLVIVHALTAMAGLTPRYPSWSMHALFMS